MAGEAAVVVSVVHIVKGERAVARFSTRGQCGGFRPISLRAISTLLPVALVANRKGIVGSSFLDGLHVRRCRGGERQGREPGDNEALIAKDQRNAERILPYLGGEEINTDPSHRASPLHYQLQVDVAG